MGSRAQKYRLSAAFCGVADQLPARYWAAADGDLDIVVQAVPLEGQHRALAWREARDLQHAASAVGKRVSIDMGDNVAGFQAGLVSGTVLINAAYQSSPRRGQAQLACDFGYQLTRFDAEPAANNAAVANDLFKHLGCAVDGDGESDSL